MQPFIQWPLAPFSLLWANILLLSQQMSHEAIFQVEQYFICHVYHLYYVCIIQVQMVLPSPRRLHAWPPFTLVQRPHWVIIEGVYSLSSLCVRILGHASPPVNVPQGLHIYAFLCNINFYTLVWKTKAAHAAAISALSNSTALLLWSSRE